MSNTDFIWPHQWEMIKFSLENVAQAALIVENVKKYIFHHHNVDRDAINQAIANQCDALLELDALLNYEK